jgi:hypothetical protein
MFESRQALRMKAYMKIGCVDYQELSTACPLSGMLYELNRKHSVT